MVNEMFSPGPWRLIFKTDKQRLDAWILAKDFTSTGRELQIISMHDMHPVKEHIERRLADIRLIAAAPEMYELLKRINEITDTNTNEISKLLARITNS